MSTAEAERRPAVCRMSVTVTPGATTDELTGVEELVASETQSNSIFTGKAGGREVTLVSIMIKNQGSNDVTSFKKTSSKFFKIHIQFWQTYSEQGVSLFDSNHTANVIILMCLSMFINKTLITETTCSCSELLIPVRPYHHTTFEQNTYVLQLVIQ